MINQASNDKIFVAVILPVAVDKEFTYLSLPCVEVGNLVLVEFGRRKYWAAVVKILSESPKNLESTKIKEIIAINSQISLKESHLRFISELASYNMASCGLVLRSFIGSLKIEKTKKSESTKPPKKPPEKPPLKIFEQKIEPQNFTLNTLRPKQAEIFQTISNHWQETKETSKKHTVFLLDGATASGKTEIYFALIAKILVEKPNSQILVLMPEIALTSQILSRFTKQFGFAAALWHSKVSTKQKKEIFLSVADGSLRVLIGARSALLMPFKNLSLIVVDEEHDTSFKQEDVFSFHARDMAILLGKIENFPVVLASATPSLESFYNAEIGKFKGFLLEQIHGSKSLLELVDKRSKKPSEEVENRFLSQRLRECLTENLAAGKQSLLFLNRRGYAPLCLCKNCGQKYGCPNCDSYLVLHKKHRACSILLCHHCGHQEKINDNKKLVDEPGLASGETNTNKNQVQGQIQGKIQRQLNLSNQLCKFCGASESLLTIGIGVEKLKEEVVLLFPSARVEVFTSDDVKNFADAEEFIKKTTNHEIDIIIGTQMIAKGYDFANLSLVGIVEADSLLYSCELKSLERAFQLLSQVIGRVGRREETGKVIIQTFEPNNFLFEKIFTADGQIKKREFYEFELANRAKSSLPPFSQMIRFEISALKEELAKNWAQKLRAQFPNDPRIRLFGPAPATVFKVRSRYHFWLHLALPHKLNLQKLVSNVLASLGNTSQVKVKTIINP